MSRNNQGGTQKWCPSCNSIQVCELLIHHGLATNLDSSGTRQSIRTFAGFVGGSVCQKCEHEWLTAEVEEGFLDELVELRNALKEIKANEEVYVKESDKAAKSLAKLSKSLGVLRALKVYKAQGKN